MGIAKTKLRDLVSRHPICCFCGGQSAATEIDHVPAKIIFPDKKRPKGLEFPACSRCNRQTSADETLLAFVSRFAGSRRLNAQRDFNRQNDIIRSISQSCPGLLERMNGGWVWAKEKGILMPAGSIDVDQPEIHFALCRVAAKLALAIYYYKVRSPASIGSLINTQWTHCHKADNFQQVNNMIDILPTLEVLQLGKWNTDDSFFLRHHFDHGVLSLVAIFHESVALIAQLAEPDVPTQWEKGQFVMAPIHDRGIDVLR